MKRIASLALIGALAACGDGGGGGAGSTVATAPAPAPAPVPTPTATPAPAPTATPASYTPFAQLAGDQNFKTACAALSYDFSPPLAVPVAPFGSGPTLGYTAATQTYVVTQDARNGGLFGPQPRSYGPDDRDAAGSSASVASYARTTNGFQERLTIGSNAAAGASPVYVRGFSLRVPLNGAATTNPPAAQYICLFGVPTRTDDLPATGFAYTRGGLNGIATNYPPSGAPESYAVTQSQVAVGVDIASRRITTTIRLAGALVTAAGTAPTTVDLGTYIGTATIDPGGYYSGQLSSPDRQIRDASFGGWFFGPQASEGAFSVGFESIDQSTGRHILFIGNALALR